MALVALLLVLSALDALVSALIGRPSLTRSALRRVSALRRAYLVARYGPPSGCTGLQPHVVEGVIVEEGAGR